MPDLADVIERALIEAINEQRRVEYSDGVQYMVMLTGDLDYAAVARAIAAAVEKERK